MDTTAEGVSVFTSVDAAMLRVTTLRSIQDYFDWPRFDVPGPGQAEHWRGWLQRVWQNANFAAAVEAASPSLAERVVDILAGRVDGVRDVRGTVESVLRYLLRAQSRATPFGLFAGIAPVAFGTEASVHNDNADRATARVDARWLADTITTLQQRPAVRDHLRVVLANTCFVRDGRLVLGLRRQLTSAGEPAEVSVRRTPLVELLATSARHPVVVGDLISAALDAFPSSPRASLAAVMDRLIEQHILITNLQPPNTCTDPLGHVVTTLAATPATSDPVAAAIVRNLRSVRDRLDRDRSATDRRSPPVSIDLRAGVRATLPHAVAREAADAAAVLTRLMPHQHGRPAWVDYHRRFLERYGVGAARPLLHLVNPDVGLGFPAGYRGSLLEEPTTPTTDRDAVLLDLAQRAALERRTEIVLDAASIDQLAGPAPVSWVPHLELTTRIHSPSLAALNTGRFTMAVIGVFRAAGTTTGRFLELLTPTERDRMIHAYTGLPTRHTDALHVQVACPPLYRDTENIAGQPRVLPHVLAINEHHVAGETVLALDDLLVVGDAQGFALWSRTRDQPVEPHLFNAVSLTTRAHPLLRFLCEITTARAATPSVFSWGLADHLPFLPSVRYRRTLLTSARWTLVQQGLPDQDWGAALTRWQETMMVPDTVWLGTGDQRLALDLTEAAHRHLLRRHLNRHPRAVLTEAPPAGAFGWLNGRAHEVTIPLATTKPPEPPPIRTRGSCTARGTEVAHLPGGSPWLTCILVGHPDRHTDLLATHLPTLLTKLAGPRPAWWYVPYRDPEHHLRLRLHLPDPAGRGAIMTHIAHWAEELRHLGMISTLRFDTYRPELGRYGGPTAIDAAEAVFAIDSAAALAQRVHGSTDLTAITAVSLLDIAIGLAGDTKTGCHWLHQHASAAPARHPTRAVYNTTLTLAHPCTGDNAIAAQPGGEEILTVWRQRRTALTRYRDTLLADHNLTPQAVLASLLHMHSVRALGIGGEQEPICLHLVRAAARAHLAYLRQREQR